MQRTPSSVAFCSVQSMRSLRETACTSVILSGESRSPALRSPTITVTRSPSIAAISQR